MPMHLPAYRNRPERFDDAVMASAQRLAQRWETKISKIQFMILPVPDDKLLDSAAAAGDRVPLSSSKSATAKSPAEITIYRLPLEQLANTPMELVDLVHQCIVHEVSEMWMLPPSEIDPEYFPEDPDF